MGALVPGTAVTVRNGRFHAFGEVVGPGEAPGTVRVFALKNKFDVAEGYVMAQDSGMTEKDYRDGYRESQEKIMKLLKLIADLEAELDALAEVVAAQMELIG